jgi:hypothetical protein
LLDTVAEARGATLFARRRDGSPTGWPMTPLWPGDGWLYFNTYRVAAKAKMMIRDGRVATVLGFDDKRALLMQADAELIVALEDLDRLVPFVLRDDGFVPADVIAKTQDRLRSGKRVLFRMRPRTVAALDAPANWRDSSPRQGHTPHAGPRLDAGRAGRDRSSLSLTEHELHDFVAHCRHAVVGWIDDDGYPSAAVVDATAERGQLMLRLPSVARGTPVCAVLDEGATYSEIVGAIVHGVLGDDGLLALDDVVSFSFAKGQV